MTETVERIRNTRGLSQELSSVISFNTRNLIVERLRLLIRERELLSGSAWADRYRVMPVGSRYRRWSTARTIYLKEIADNASSNDYFCQEIIIAKAAQIGGSELALNEILRRMHNDPCAILLYMENDDKVKEWLLKRFDPAVMQPPFHGRGIRNQGQLREFPGGSLVAHGVGSGAALSSTTARLVVGDEAARYPLSISGEGDFLSLASGRAATFGTLKKILIISTPLDTLEGEGTFVTWHKGGDDRRYHCPCPHCGHEWEWTVEDLRRVGDDAVMVCPECGGITEDGDERTEAVLNGKWVPSKEAEVPWRISYVLSGLIAPSTWRPWAQIMEQHRNAIEGKASLQAFYNTVLGLPFDEPEARVPSKDKVAKRLKGEEDGTAQYRAGHIPDGVSILTLAIDVQGAYLDYEVKGWGKGMENWSIERKQIDIDILRSPGAAVAAIKLLFAKTWRNADGVEFRLWAGAIDSGFRYEVVCNMTEAFPKPVLEASRWRIPRGSLMPTRGANVAITDRLIQNVPGGRTARGQKKSYRHWRLGTDVAKRELYQILNNKDVPMHSRPHAPIDYPDSHFEELVAEQIIARPNPQTKKVQMVFHLPPGRRNEALDLHVMNRFVVTALNCDEWTPEQWDRMTPKAEKTPSRLSDKMAKRRENRRKRMESRRK